jgi:hypothetical protein
MHATKAHTNNASATVQIDQRTQSQKPKKNKTKQNKHFFIAVLVWFLHDMNSRDLLLSFVHSRCVQTHAMNWLHHHRT